ncbi:hypothetical protein [Clostridium botulinum]|uniref:hypothetical protein n=1 Tax=Clostridium botulinum TaxID=1491 RepID=UPI001E49FB9E|nr:hypothetical protein [Clostridium botulinum]MCD3254365.1 hypothetical protein [Clostridium botulinum C/D]MCD3279865.1 hypothetical protein [Clostridium botulinum C/D]MCD3339596.1 hypothetical protein [Clostridium botulinum C/D]MCD3357504.1 hypothetical protein [Clostridium botulinum C/D]
MNNKRYIYNWQQAYFYMENGVMPIERPQKHFETGNIFFVFDNEETQKVYDKWCENQNK